VIPGGNIMVMRAAKIKDGGKVPSITVLESLRMILLEYFLSRVLRIEAALKLPRKKNKV